MDYRGIIKPEGEPDTLSGRELRGQNSTSRAEAERLARLQRYGVLGTPPEPAFDEIAALAARLGQAPIALITLVGSDRVWYKSRIGIDLPESQRAGSLCDRAIRSSEVTVIPDLLEDPRLSGHPLAVADPPLRFYAGAPLRSPEGFSLGTLCLLDYRPRTLDADQREGLEVLARQVVTLMELRCRAAELAETIERRRRLDRALSQLTQGVSTSTGEAFFRRLVQHLGQVLGLEYILVGERVAEADTVRTLAVWAGGRIGENFTYALAGTPCEDVVNQRVCIHPAGVTARFPEDRMLDDLGVESYAGTPLFSHTGEVLGLLVGMGRHPIADRDHVEAVLQFFALRAAAEMERLRSEAKLRELAERREFALSAAEVGTFDWDIGTGEVRWSTIKESLFGLAPGEFRGTREHFEELLHPEDRPLVGAAIEQCLQGGNTYRIEFRVRRPDGTERWILTVGRLVRDREGRPVRLGGICRDVTEIKLLEGELRQAHKLEAVGKLAGGVAHEFNNALTVILGHCELLRNRYPAGNVRDAVEQIYRSGERAASVTRQLLAFSRKQILSPRLLNLNEVVLDLRRMLEPLIGEDIALEIGLDPDLPRVQADRSQMEQVLLNLALNARDAMPMGGSLRVETRPYSLAGRHPVLPPGPYALLSVTDTGCGISPEILPRIFEPFFTTKQVGQGTGLGLATVYGIVRQSGGHVEVSSTLDQGTTLRIYLPGVPAAAEPESIPLPPRLPAGTETVLLAEDEPPVRRLVREFLELGGYRVLEASGAAAALELEAAHSGPIQLLVTDVVMPEKSGPALYAELAGRRPELRVLFISGHSEDPVLRSAVLDAGAPLLQKPFDRPELLERVREVLDGPPRAARGVSPVPPGAPGGEP